MDRSHRDATRRSTSSDLDPASEFELSFEVEFERVFRAAYLATGNRHDADDLADLAFLHVWDRWDRTRAHDNPTAVAIGWTMGRGRVGTARLAMRRHRAAWRRRARRLRARPFDDVGLDDDLRSALAATPPGDRAAIALVRGLHFTHREAARALGCRTSAVRIRLARGEAGWLQRLAPDGPPDGRSDPIEGTLETLRRVAVPRPGSFARHLDARSRAARHRRVGVIAAVAIVSALIAFVAGRGTDDRASPVPSQPEAAFERTPSGRYRLPGMLMAASVTVPDGWRVGNSIWGSDGPGFAALSTGTPGMTVSVAVFDLVMLSPYDPATGAPRTLEADWRAGWFARFGRSFDRQIRSRIAGSAGTDLRTFHPWSPLAWVLAHAPKEGPIQVSEPVIDGRDGSLVSFVNTGPTSALFAVYGNGTIEMRPDVTYTFWAPAGDETMAGDVLIAIAREAGADPSTAEWDVIRSLKIRGY